MPQNPGNNTVRFTYPGVVSDRLNKSTGTASSTNFTQTGCYVTPVTVQDKITDTDYSYATVKCLTPASASAQTVIAEWFAAFNNLTYRILGVRFHYDRWARLDHLTFYMKEENV